MSTLQSDSFVALTKRGDHYELEAHFPIKGVYSFQMRDIMNTLQELVVKDAEDE